AFEALLLRHAPLVLGICRRVLSSEHDVEDAFQATFFVLLRKASSIRKQTSVAAWLYGVAYRIALKARAGARREAPRGLQDVPVPVGERFQALASPLAEASGQEVQAIVDEELAHLPERFRAPLILCALAGRRNAEAARQLGVNEGTIASRLA